MSKKNKVPKRAVVLQETPEPKKSVFKSPWLWILLVLVLAAAAVACWLLKPSAPAEKTPIEPTKTEMSAALDTLVVSTLYEQHYTDHTEGKCPVVTYTALDVREEDDTVTVYGVMMYREYTCTTQNEWEVWGNAHSSFALTAREAEGAYELVECWWPSNGADYRSSIEEKFPESCYEDAIQCQQYYSAHEAACKAQVEQKVAEAEKYTVLTSERDNVRLAYCVKTATCYITFSGGYATDGTYVLEDARRVFTFGDSRLVFTIDGKACVYDQEASQNVSADWESSDYLTAGVKFAFAGKQEDVKEETAPVGLTVTVSGSSWMNEEELREMFDEYMVSNFPYDSADVRYLPVMTIKYRGDLDSFLAAYVEDPQWQGLEADAFAQFDEAFFEDNYLMMTYYKDGMASSIPKVSSYVFAEDGAWLSVRLEVETSAAGDTAVGQWLLFSGIAKEDHKRFKNGIEAYVENTVPVDGYAAAYTQLEDYPEAATELWREFYSKADGQALGAMLTRLDTEDGWFSVDTLDQVPLYIGSFHLNGLYYVTENCEAIVGADGQCGQLADEEMALLRRLIMHIEESVEPDVQDGTLSFTGTVTQVEGRAMLMETDDVEQFHSGVWVELGEAELDPMVGETYTVTYEDVVMPSLPPRITAVTITKP